jgi:hypothetical protein
MSRVNLLYVKINGREWKGSESGKEKECERASVDIIDSW